MSQTVKPDMMLWILCRLLHLQ